ncbi:pilus assembly protein PapD [Advenella kashmirensis W13003]|uniref:Pilus assembly protein PapD n=1 Tax=Advenella kashmirensis W13003 TaxID=1424334 RepID=V8QXI3_9BURK|nr:molecular chaperone [Advenella kashmirensis]ETF04367.1 pilus assembly protein PapD [Advenella kashmirensis W13003]
MQLLCRTWLYILLTLMTGAGAHAAGLQVTPIVLNIQQTQKSDGLWLTNTSSQPMDVQVRVFEWLQQNETDVLNPTPEFVASPPLVKIPSGQKQFVRLVRVGQKPATGERAYRIVVDELPLERATTKGLTFALRYSIPVFIQGSVATATPSLAWELRRGVGGDVLLAVTNSGPTRAKLSAVKFVSKNGRSVMINKGLFGYALANSSRQWTISKNAKVFAAGGHFEITMNGKNLNVPFAGFR